MNENNSIGDLLPNSNSNSRTTGLDVFSVFIAISQVLQTLELGSKLDWREAERVEIMTTLSKNDVKQSTLHDRLVLDFDTTETVGRVKQLWLDLKSHQVKGLTCARGAFDREKQMFFWNKVVTVGHDSILVNTENQEQVEQPESTDNVIGLQVWTDAGNKAGKLVDYCIDTKTGAIVAYLFVSNGWRGIANGTYTLPPDAIITIGSKRIIVAETGIQNAQQYAEGLNKKVQHAKEFIHDDIAKSREDFGVVVQNTQKAASGLQTKAHQATEVVKGKLSDAAERLQHQREVSAKTKDKSARSEEKNIEAPDASRENAF